jgi:hypothetical protein
MEIRSPLFFVVPLAIVITFAPGQVDANAAAPTAHPCVDSGQCPTPGWWQPPDNTIVYDNASEGYRIDWVQSYVVPPPADKVPAWFTVILEYWNHGNSIQYFTCKGVEDPTLAKEWFLRDGKEIGYVTASTTHAQKIRT